MYHWISFIQFKSYWKYSDDVRKLDKRMKQLDKTCSGILLAFIDGECHNRYPVLTIKMHRQ